MKIKIITPFRFESSENMKSYMYYLDFSTGLYVQKLHLRVIYKFSILGLGLKIEKKAPPKYTKTGAYIYEVD